METTHKPGTRMTGLAMFDDGTWKEVSTTLPCLMSDSEIFNRMLREQGGLRGKCFAVVLIREE